MVKGVCTNCQKEKDVAGDGKSKGLCHVCYKALLWKPRLIKCKRCERERPMHAKGLCNGCYNSVFHVEKVKMHKVKKYHKIDQGLYQKITNFCVVCGFDKIVDLHHLDMNHSNNSKENLTGLCPNHHRMVHNRAFQKEVFQQLRDKGFSVPEGFKDDSLFKN